MGDVIEWHKNPTNPYEGFAEIQLLAAAAEVRRVKRGRPGEPIGSPGRPDWLPNTTGRENLRSRFVLELARDRRRGRPPAPARRSPAVVWLERAEGLRGRMAAEGLSRADMARALGQTRAAVSRTMAILTLPAVVLDHVRSASSPITATTIWKLLRAPEKDRLLVAGALVAGFREWPGAVARK